MNLSNDSAAAMSLLQRLSMIAAAELHLMESLKRLAKDEKPVKTESFLILKSFGFSDDVASCGTTMRW